MSEVNSVRIGQSESALEAVVKCMVDGNISFADFTILSENEKDVFKLCEISENLKKSNTAIQAAFVARRAEMEKFMKFSKLLAGFWSDCKPAVAGKSLCIMICYVLTLNKNCPYQCCINIAMVLLCKI